MLTASKLNKIIILKLPSAYLCGVRLKELTESDCKTSVKFRWINQNPFKSIYFAVLAMAAELATGALVLRKTENIRISTLVLGMSAQFHKKAVGRITFSCNQGLDVDNYIRKAIATKEGVVFPLKALGVDAEGDTVAEFVFEWTIKVKS
ncbi:DUF4442 domain-containing protein [Flavobacteriaceae bacterium]|nr:DUF4442 domain-containing protein [Flavobacteriaceae bacterium]